MAEQKIKKQIFREEGLKVILFFLFIGLYIFLLPLGFETIDPCASTPGHDFTTGIFFLILFPLLVGLLFYFFFIYKDELDVSCLVKTILFSIVGVIVCFVLSLLLLAMWLDLAEGIFRLSIRNTDYYSIFFEYGCYNDVELKSVFVNALFAINFLICSFFLWMLWRILKKIKK